VIIFSLTRSTRCRRCLRLASAHASSARPASVRALDRPAEAVIHVARSRLAFRGQRALVGPGLKVRILPAAHHAAVAEWLNALGLLIPTSQPSLKRTKNLSRSSSAWALVREHQRPARRRRS
jgi:hypothetical protein